MSPFSYELTRNQIHCLFPYELFQDDNIRALFHEAGITKEMKGNLRGLFSAEDGEIVRRVHPIVRRFLDKDVLEKMGVKPVTGSIS